MGRLATAIAALAIDADNLPPSYQLPNVSLIDALLPRSLAGPGPAKTEGKSQKPLDPIIGSKTCVTYYDIKKDKSGNKSFVRHKTHNSSVVSVHSKAEAKEEKKECDCKCGCKTCGAVKVGEEKAGNGDSEKNASRASDKKEEEKKGSKASEKKAEEEKDEKNGNGKESNGKNMSSSKPFTTEEDAKLKELKAPGTNVAWRDIVKEMKRPQAELQARWKEIRGDGDAAKPAEEKKGENKEKENGDGNGKKDEPTPATNAANETKRMTKAERRAAKKAEEERADAPAPAPTPAPPAATKPTPSEPKPLSTHKTASKHSSRSHRSEARFTMREWQTLQEDELFSFGELQCLSEIIMKDTSQTWLRVASRFYDLTGRRVHPEDIREKFEKLMEMAG